MGFLKVKNTVSGCKNQLDRFNSKMEVTINEVGKGTLKQRKGLKENEECFSDLCDNIKRSHKQKF